MANAPERPREASEPTDSKEAPKPAPRTDTVVAAAAASERTRDVPTWLAVVAILALSLLAGMTTYLVRLRATADAPVSPTASVDGPGAKTR
jgi:hypothetical protein